MSLGVVLTGGSVGITAMGDGTNLVNSNNVLDDYSAIYLDDSSSLGIIFRCATGLGPGGSDNNDVIGDLYYNDMVLPKGTCSGLLQAGGTRNVVRYPGVYDGRLCSPLTTITEGIYTCTLTNSSNMPQSVRVGVYFNGRSESIYNV